MIKTEKVYYSSYPAVSRLVHVTLNLACICHQVLHSPILQCCGVWGGEYGLYTEESRKLNSETTWSINFISVFIWQNEGIYNASISLQHLQFVHQVGTQVLSDMFMPGLPYPCGRERRGSRQVSHASPNWPIWHQLTKDRDKLIPKLNSTYGFINSKMWTEYAIYIVIYYILLMSSKIHFKITF